jgi:hypothetical protein
MSVQRACREAHGDPRATAEQCSVCRFSVRHPGFYAGDQPFVGDGPPPKPPAPPTRGPGLVRKAMNFAGAVARHTLAGLPVVDDATYQARLETCGRCPRLDAEGSCNLCGCPVRDKAMWGEQHCPCCSRCGRPEGDHPAEGCDGFEPKWPAAPGVAREARAKKCCGG